MSQPTIMTTEQEQKLDSWTESKILMWKCKPAHPTQEERREEDSILFSELPQSSLETKMP